MDEARPDPGDAGTYDDGEAFDAADAGPVVVPDGTDAILYAAALEQLADAGFPRDPNDPTGALLGQGAA